MPIRLPSISQRISVLGRTGSGKTVFAAWLLSVSAFDQQPYIIIDYKGDELLNSVDRIREIGLKEKLPTANGVYIVHPRPKIDDDLVEDFLHRIWEHERVGLFFDEAYMVPTRGALEGILTQGRSLKIPAIVLSQRPAWISRFVFSEADFFAIFHLNVKDDRLRLNQIVGDNLEPLLTPSGEPAEFFSRYYDVGRAKMDILQPVPGPAIIQQTLHDRLKPEAQKRVRFF